MTLVRAAGRRPRSTGSSRATSAYAFHVYAFGSLAANPFPGFTGKPGVYPLDLVAARARAPEPLEDPLPRRARDPGVDRQPAGSAASSWSRDPHLVRGALHRGGAGGAAQPLGWALRYIGQTNAYLYLLTDAYPHASPLEGAEPEPSRAARSRSPCRPREPPRALRGGHGRRAGRGLDASPRGSSGRRPFRPRSTCRTSTPRRLFPRARAPPRRPYDHVASLLASPGSCSSSPSSRVYSWRGPRFVRESAAGPVGTGMLLGMLGFGLLWLAEVPFTLLALWWDRRHDVSHESYWHAVARRLARARVRSSSCSASRCDRDGASRGWSATGGGSSPPPCSSASSPLFAFVSPYLQPTHPIARPRLAAAVARSSGARTPGTCPCGSRTSRRTRRRTP